MPLFEKQGVWNGKLGLFEFDLGNVDLTKMTEKAANKIQKVKALLIFENLLIFIDIFTFSF